MQLLSPPLPSSILTRPCPPHTPFFIPPFGPFSFTLLISSFTLLAQVVIEWEASLAYMHLWTGISTDKHTKESDQICWSMLKILKSDLATMAINHLLFSALLSLFIVISHSPHSHPTPSFSTSTTFQTFGSRWNRGAGPAVASVCEAFVPLLIIVLM